MGLPLILAMTPAEIFMSPILPERLAWMACHFSPYGEGLTTLPDLLPAGSMLILDDWMPCTGHSAALAAHQLSAVISRLDCESVLLDFQHPPDKDSKAVVRELEQKLSCPVAVTAPYADKFDGPVLLAPAPLHIPAEEYFAPWHGREIWLEAAFCEETIRVMAEGTSFSPCTQPAWQDGGLYDEKLCCEYHMQTEQGTLIFTLYDTPRTLPRKLERARQLGVSRAVGLYQQLRCLQENV